MRPIVNYSLHSADKADIPAENHKYRFYELCDQYADYCHIYTDGSKAGERVASAIIYKGITKSVLNYMLYFWQSMLFADQSEKIRNFLRFAIYTVSTKKVTP